MFGVALGIVSSFQLFKVPPVLPVLLGTYGYGKLLAGGLMTVYALVGLLLATSLAI